MSTEKTDALISLITSLTKSERKNFTMMSKKAGRDQLLYLDLYKHIQYYGKYDEALVKKKLPQIKASQLSNLKANLYKQILRSLRDIHKENYLEIKAREQFDFAKILYAKGQYVASLEMLNKAKALAKKINKLPLQYLALSFEKHIESQHVTGSMSPKAAALSSESYGIITALNLTNQLSNLSLLMYGKYLQLGIARSQEEKTQLNDFMMSQMPVFQLEDLDFYQKLYLYQAYVWYYMMTQDFAKKYKYAKLWVKLYEENPEMRRIETVVYIKGIHNVLNALFLSNKTKRFESVLKQLNEFNSDNSYVLSINESSQLTLFQYIHNVNYIFLKANYKASIQTVDELALLLKENPSIWDLNRRLVFRYKIACVYFGAGNTDQAIYHLNKITNHKYLSFKEDIQCFARILKLIAHFDIGHEDLVSYNVRTVYRFLLKMKELQAVQKEILKFIRKTPSIRQEHLLEEFKQLRSKLINLEKDKLERRPFLYLDIISWLDSKIYSITMVEAILKRRKN